MVSSIREHEVPLVFVPSPNNPTGTPRARAHSPPPDGLAHRIIKTGNVMSEDQVRKLCQEKCVVVIDEAYIEFSGTLFPFSPLQFYLAVSSSLAPSAPRSAVVCRWLVAIRVPQLGRVPHLQVRCSLFPCALAHA
jgi:hypothetical protein